MRFSLLILVLAAATLFGIPVVASGQYVYNGFSPVSSHQLSYSLNSGFEPASLLKKKLYQRNYGIVLGLQRGKNTMIELGGEAHWKKISLLKPRIFGATANLEYDLANNIAGYKAGIWKKTGHINFTYGANVGYYTNFKDGNRFGIGPSIGFRLLGLHLVNGFTLLTADKGEKSETSLPVNSVYMSLRYYVPMKNKFTWDRQTMKKKKERRKAREERKELRLKNQKKNKEDDGEKGLKRLFKKKEETTQRRGS